MIFSTSHKGKLYLIEGSVAQRTVSLPNNDVSIIHSNKLLFINRVKFRCFRWVNYRSKIQISLTDNLFCQITKRSFTNSDQNVLRKLHIRNLNKELQCF